MSEITVTKTDFIYFQNDILKELKKIENKFNNKLLESIEILKEKVTINENKVNLFKDKFNELSNICVEEKNFFEKVEKLIKFKEKIEDENLLFNSKLNNLQKFMNDNFYKYDRIFTNNFIVPGIIGDNCKFPNLKNFLEFSYSNFENLNKFKEKQNIDQKMYKEKLENIINQFKIQMGNEEIKNQNSINNKIAVLDNKFEEKFLALDNKINSLKIENNDFVADLKKKFLDLENNYKNFEVVKEKNQKILDDFLNENNQQKNFFNENKNEIFQINFKLNEIYKFIEEINVKINNINYNQNNNNNDFNENKKIFFKEIEKLKEDINNNLNFIKFFRFELKKYK